MQNNDLTVFSFMVITHINTLCNSLQNACFTFILSCAHFFLL